MKSRIDGAVPFGLALIALGVLFTLDVVEVSVGARISPGLLLLVGDARLAVSDGGRDRDRPARISARCSPGAPRRAR